MLHKEGMLKRLWFILAVVTTTANAQMLTGDVVFRPGDVVQGGALYVTRTLTIENYSSVNTDMYITCDNCDVFIKNA